PAAGHRCADTRRRGRCRGRGTVSFAVAPPRAAGAGRRRCAPMIGSLRGVLVSKAPPQLLLEVAGVGYEIEAPMSTFYTLPPAGQELRLLTHLVVRDDAHVLYGF